VFPLKVSLIFHIKGKFTLPPKKIAVVFEPT
jgi:hypothetical protein